MKSKIPLLFLLLSNQLIFAQLVNIEKMRRYNYDGWQGNIELSGQLKQNSNQIIQLNNQLDIQYYHKSNNYIFINSLSLMNINNEDLVNTGFQHLRYNYTFRDSSMITFELFAQHQYNSIKLLKQRNIAGTGPRFRLSNNKKLILFLAPLIMFESEWLSDEFKSQTQQWKLDAYMALSLAFTDKIAFKHITYYQPRLALFSDYRISSQSDLEFVVWKKLKMGLSFSLDWDADPPAELDGLFYSLQQKIAFRF